jgi:Mn2+/Fe2+ NRAMP family transporter
MMSVFVRAKGVHHHKKRRHIRDYLMMAKDGVITGSADNDPSGIVTYTQVGAATRFSQLWLVLIAIPMLVVVEEMSARVGVVTKKGLNLVIRDQFGRFADLSAMILVIICNTATLGADMAGMAAVLGMLVGIHWTWFLIPVAAIILYFLIRQSYAVVSRLLFLITPIFLVYIVTGFIVNPPWREVVKSTFLPSVNFTPGFLAAAVALLGTTISAYLLFWQTTEEVEDHKTVGDLKEESYGVMAGMLYSSLVFYFIILCGGAVLFGKVKLIETAAQAATALKPLAGNLSYILFSVGILGSGLLAVPVLAMSTAYVVGDTLGWQEGIDKSFHKAKGFYLVMALSLTFGAAMSLFGLKPMLMLFYSQVLQGVLTPLLLILLILVANNSGIMGEHTNPRWSNIIGWITVIVMLSFSLLMFRQIIFG